MHLGRRYILNVIQDIIILIFMASAPIVRKITRGAPLMKLVTVSKRTLFVCRCACSGGGGGVFLLNTYLDSFSTMAMMIFHGKQGFREQDRCLSFDKSPGKFFVGCCVDKCEFHVFLYHSELKKMLWHELTRVV